ncbi:MAG TPA: hypothetical protein GX710_06725, partial [Clostridiales bacterium]|nr:hypothetical protein [Clostridiales bacterium]
EENLTLYGDINSDGVVNNSDVDILKKAVFGIGSLTESEFLSADLNGDGKLNTFDLAKISKLVKEKRNLRVVEDYDYRNDYTDFITAEWIYPIYAYGRNEYYNMAGDVYGVTDEGYTEKQVNLHFFLNGIKHFIPTALESGIVTIDEIANVNYDVRISAREYLDLSFVKVIPPADDVIIQPATEFLYNDGKYDYYFNNILSGLYIIEMHGKQYSLREVIDNQLLTPGELTSLGLFDFKISAPFEKIKTIEINDPIYNNKAGLFFGDMLQLIYQDEKHNYYLSSLRGEYISVTINGIEFSLKEVIENEILTIDELIDAGLEARTGNYANGSRL